MITIKSYLRASDADFAKSVLHAARINALLADEHSFLIGGGSAIEGIRLQVSEAEADHAMQILREQEGFTPLPENFVPPNIPREDPAELPSPRKVRTNHRFDY